MFDFKTLVILGGIAVFLIMLAVLVVFIIKKYLNDRKDPRNQYDERQKAVQGVGYKIALFVLVGYDVINGIVCMFTKPWADVFVMSFIGICLALIAFLGYSIWNDAYITMASNLLSLNILNLAIGVMNIVQVCINGFDDSDLITITLINLTIGITFLIISIIGFIKMLYDKIMEKKEIEE